ELVVRAAPGMGGGYGGERPTLGDHALGATHRMLVELGWPEVPMDGALRREARGLQRGGPFAFGGTGGMRGHAFSSDRRVQARERRPYSCASTAAITAMFTISFTSEPRCSTRTGCAIPTPLPSITGLPASGPMLPTPSTAVPFVTTATRFPLAV